MAKSKMITCKHCGAEIVASAKVCPHCGGKNKPPIYKRWWFILLVAFVFLSYLGSDSTGSSSSAKEGFKEGFEKGYKDATASSGKATSESASPSVATSDSPAIDESQEIRSFLRLNKEVNEAFAKNLADVLDSTGLGTLDDITWFEQTDDWAAGKRYNAQVNIKDYIQIATIGDEIYSIKNTKNNEVDDFIYKNESLKPDAGDVQDGSILLTDGELGDYGKEATTKSGYKYVRYAVPAGNYTVENRAKQSMIFVVSDSNSDDVSATLQLTSDGEKGSLTVKNGYHIELSEYSQVVLTPNK